MGARWFLAFLVWRFPSAPKSAPPAPWLAKQAPKPTPEPVIPEPPQLLLPADAQAAIDLQCAVEDPTIWHEVSCALVEELARERIEHQVADLAAWQADLLSDEVVRILAHTMASRAR